VTARTLEQRRRAAVKSRDAEDCHHYFSCVSETRFVLRKVFRIVEEQAKTAGLDSLEHQALLQVYGAPDMRLQIKAVAERLDVPAAFASVLVKSLNERGLVSSARSSRDQRVAEVRPTRAGIDLLQQIDDRVKFHVDYFTGQLSAEQKERAVAILLFYVGLSVHPS